RPRWVSILTITGGSSIAAIIFKAPPQLGQCSRSMSKTRLAVGPNSCAVSPPARGKQGGGQPRDAPADDEGCQTGPTALAHRPTATAVLGGKMALTLHELKM